MATGACVGWKDENGYGWIRPDGGGADVFVHRRDITNTKALAQGWRVSFEIATDDRHGKPKATRVTVV